uniref:Uncharacterized protein n=1 Tax=Arundo donax TaxID=35708 RepID=A0A0A9B7A7_ARUDO
MSDARAGTMIMLFIQESKPSHAPSRDSAPLILKCNNRCIILIGGLVWSTNKK